MMSYVSDLTFGEPFGALELGDYTDWMRFVLHFTFRRLGRKSTPIDE